MVAAVAGSRKNAVIGEQKSNIPGFGNQGHFMVFFMA
jgi:hypothetical protein